MLRPVIHVRDENQPSREYSLCVAYSPNGPMTGGPFIHVIHEEQAVVSYGLQCGRQGDELALREASSPRTPPVVTSPAEL